jgi:hypothetical protein
MLIPGWLYDVLLYTLAGCAVLSLIYYAYFRREPSEALPHAQVRTQRPRWRRAVAWLPAFTFFGGLFGAWFVFRSDDDVIRVHDDGGGIMVERMKVLGAPRYPYVTGHVASGHTWVINDSARPVRIEEIQCRATSFEMPSTTTPVLPTLVAPGHMVKVYSIDHVGPDDQPPLSIAVPGGLGGSRSWLTWD